MSEASWRVRLSMFAGGSFPSSLLIFLIAQICLSEAGAAVFRTVTGPAPGLGQHNEAVMRDVLGLSAERIAALKADGIFGPPERA